MQQGARPNQTGGSTSGSGMGFRRKLHEALEGRSGAGLTGLQKASATTIVLSVLFAIAVSEPVISDALGNWSRWTELAFGTLFAVEYFARAYAAGVDLRYRGGVGLIRHLVRPMSVIDLVSLLPFLVGVGAEAFLVRMIRLFRLIALSRLVRYSSALRLVVNSVYSRRHELVLAVSMAGCVMLLAAAALYAVEGEVQPNAFGSIPRALWWAVSALSTVGYGDVVPVTPIGKICAACTAVAGIGLIAMPTGILAAAFSEAFAATRAAADRKRETGDGNDGAGE
jgi:voltage-gated potassium channel